MIKDAGRSEDWTVKFETHSRDDVMKVCALLALGIGKDIVSQDRLRVYIIGTLNAGKTAITDGLIAALSDGMQSYKLPQTSLLEDYQGQAFLDGDIFKRFTVNGVETLFTLGRSDFAIKNWDVCDTFLKASASRNETAGLDYMTTCWKERPASTDISIEYKDLHSDKIFGPEWDRGWSITILNEKLQTPRMDNIFNHLRAFHDRRQMRRQTAVSGVAEPT